MLTFRMFQGASAARDLDWIAQSRPWLLPEYSNAAAGEMGELCNYVKKLQRIRDGARNVSDTTMTDEREVLRAIGHEVADVLSYLAILCTQAGIDMEDALIEKYNIVSDRVGLPQHKLRA